LAATKVGKKQFEAAQSMLENLLKQKPNNAQLQYAMGSVLYLQSHLDDAANHLRESVRLQPEQLAPYYYLALVARDQGRDSEAIQDLEKLLQRYPDHGPSCEALGSLLMSAQRYPEAEVNLEKAVRLNPKSVKANYQLGLLLTRMGKKEEADKRLELAKALRKEDTENSRLQLRLTDPDQ
jgi:tetratricopeptide (TPR) repeat protein